MYGVCVCVVCMVLCTTTTTTTKTTTTMCKKNEAVDEVDEDDMCDEPTADYAAAFARLPSAVKEFVHKFGRRDGNVRETLTTAIVVYPLFALEFSSTLSLQSKASLIT